MLEIKKIRLFELDDFVKSEIFQEFSVVPITSFRAKSYLRNPLAESDDVVLYLGLVKNQLVAFRSLFADVAFVNNSPIRFAWCSGSWVSPDHRRKGFSQQLLAEAYSDWQGMLMLTNYSPETERLFIKTGWFRPVHRFDGVRCYLFPKTGKLLTVSNRNKFTGLFFLSVDFLIRFFSSLKTRFYKPRINSSFRFEELQFPDVECFERIRESKGTYLFNRGEEHLKWIFEYPWISDSDKGFREIYPFSSFSTEFYYRTVKIFHLNRFVGFFIFSVREGHLKTLYFQISKELEGEIASYLKKYCVDNKIEMATIYNSELAGVLFKQKFPFLRVKKMGQKIYSTFAVSGDLQLQDGDGDVFFT
ncbi:GNAT family N-acetyltransferase [Maribellus maritimus]|uniref:GNAT family N-acetyltransferase n=1 Tax=Maribellus maritimus TaxID=2870838 RepID=UPI001EEA3A5B|nr:GNAT family N-acetyltransferase [Maribellus maritimus]MCG6189149.1 GNAT family N-acetyltransferase [Maribellus maritimus]